MNLLEPFLRFVLGLVLCAFAIRLAYDAVRPALPAIGILIVLVAVVRVIAWYRDRW
jgi:hypothetical protein